jgi:AcrR family transcriptional regulator
MARHRFDKLEPEKQEAILRASGREFAEKGYESASINRIIERSGMSKGSVYYYFEDKADLFATTLERSIERMMREVGWLSLEVLDPDEFWDAVMELTHRSVDFVRRDEWWVRLARAIYRLQREPGAEAAAVRLRNLGRGWWQLLIDRGQRIGVIRTDLPQDLLVEIAIGADQGGDRWMMDHWEDLSEEELRSIIDGRVDLLRDMLAKENEGWERR